MFKYGVISFLIIGFLSLFACNNSKTKSIVNNYDSKIDSFKNIEDVKTKIDSFESLLLKEKDYFTLDPRKETIVRNYLCFFYIQFNQNQKALEHSFKALEIGKNLEKQKGKDSSNLDNIYFNIAQAYIAILDNKNYLFYLNKSKKYCKINDYELKGVIDQSIACFYVEEAKTDTMLTDSINWYSQSAIANLSKANYKDSIFIFEAKTNIANYYIQRNMFDSAIVVLIHVISYLESKNQDVLLAKSLLAKCYIKKKEFIRAANILEKTLLGINDSVYYKRKINIYSRLEELYATQKNYRQLANVRGQLLDIMDKDFTKEITNKTKEIEASYVYKQKDIAIKELNVENKLSQQKIQMRNILLLALFVITMVVIAFLFQYFKSKKIKEENVRINLEQKLFAAQINPHFMFNALTAIQAEVVSNNPKKANLYLTTFGQLLQNILQSTVQEYIPISNEYKNWINYLELQKLRFKNFDYSINAYPNIDSDENQIAPMLVQPLIENAIEHGVKNTDERGILQLNIMKLDNNLKIEILDNGNGIQQMINENKISISTQLIEKRLQFLSKEFNTNSYLEIKNRTDTNGVKAIIVLPIKNA